MHVVFRLLINIQNITLCNTFEKSKVALHFALLNYIGKYFLILRTWYILAYNPLYSCFYLKQSYLRQ